MIGTNRKQKTTGDHEPCETFGPTFSAGPMGLGPTDHMGPLSPLRIMNPLIPGGPAGSPRHMNAFGLVSLPHPTGNVDLVSHITLIDPMVPESPRSPMGCEPSEPHKPERPSEYFMGPMSSMGPYGTMDS